MADVELLPLPYPHWIGMDTCDAPGPRYYTADQMHAYSRANVEHHTEPLRADHTALRAEYYRVVHALQDEQARAERLAEALRVARARAADLAAWLKSGNDVPADLPFVFRERWQKIANDIRALEAALAQEDRNG